MITKRDSITTIINSKALKDGKTAQYVLIDQAMLFLRLFNGMEILKHTVCVTVTEASQ